MVLDYVSVDLVHEDAVCPHCGSDLVLRFENGVLFVLCVDCNFSQVDTPAYSPRRRLYHVSESRQSSFSII